MVNRSFRSLIKENAMLMFDGDYDVLAVTLHDMILTGGEEETVEQLLVKEYEALPDKYNGMSGNEFLQYALLAVPNLQISVPVNCDDWNTQIYIPNVIPLPCNFNDTANNIISYDCNLVSSTVSTRVLPTVPYVVVGMSERVDMNCNLKYINQSSNYVPYQFSQGQETTSPDYPASLTVSQGGVRELVLQWSDVSNENGYILYRKHLSGGFHPIDTLGANENVYTDSCLIGGDQYWYTVRSYNSGGLSPYSPIKTTWASNRRDNQPLSIKRIKYTSDALYSVESWLKGSPEIRIVLAHGTDNGTSANKMYNAVSEPSHRCDIENRWWDCNIQLSSGWRTDQAGTCLAIYFAEDDCFNLKKFSITTNYEDKLVNYNDTTNTTTNQGLGTIKFGGTFEFESDDPSGQTEIHFWDPSTTYQIGGITFELE